MWFWRQSFATQNPPHRAHCIFPIPGFEFLLYFLLCSQDQHESNKLPEKERPCSATVWTEQHGKCYEEGGVNPSFTQREEAAESLIFCISTKKREEGSPALTLLMCSAMVW